jgi:hypothetical protein
MYRIVSKKPSDCSAEELELATNNSFRPLLDRPVHDRWRYNRVGILAP